jgi:3',5'-cyclic AMP phosphodiesterase CpdA
VLGQRPSLVFLLGDNVYSWGEKERIPEVFDKPFAPLLAAGIRVHGTLGNHDVWACETVDERPLPATADAYRWRDAGCAVDDQLLHPGFGYRGGRRYYSVALGPGPRPLAEVFVLDTNTLAVRGTKAWPGDDHAQLAWLDAALAASRARWKIVTVHHPPHSPGAWLSAFGFGGHEREVQLNAQLAPILERHEVHAVMAGHNHFYARMKPQKGTTYFVVGAGARPPYGFSWAPGYVMAGGGFLSFLMVRLTDDTFEFRAIDDHGRVRDEGRVEEAP